jgi:nucleotide-binding universal stress UspA family protein
MYRDVLVHLKSYETWSPHIDAALALAARSGAFVTGLLTLQSLAIARYLSAEHGASGDFIERIREQAEATTTSLKAKFESALTMRGLQGVFESAEGRANDVLSHAGRFHDLIVVEQTKTEHDEVSWSTSEEAAVQCGRPTLIIPHTGAFESRFERVLVAWNGSRQSTRALHAALPLIEDAEKVVVLEGRYRDGFSPIMSPPSMRIGAYLERHAKSVDVLHTDVKDSDAADEILETATTTGSQLIVMGAMGRAGLSRMILGGATSKVFRNTRVPILAAH